MLFILEVCLPLHKLFNSESFVIMCLKSANADTLPQVVITNLALVFFLQLTGEGFLQKGPDSVNFF